MDNMHIAVACRNASGMPDVPVFTVAVTPRDIEEGTHYDKAIALAEDARYEGPFVCFDAEEAGPILVAARALDLIPQVVVIDMTDGAVQSVRCDAGEIKVICYDENDTEETSAAMADRPLGEGGQLGRCGAPVQTADVDPGLTKVRG